MSNVPLTREAFEALLMEDSARGNKAIARALVALAKRQTIDERTTLSTKYQNKLGFNAVDARAGTGNAEYYLKHGFLSGKQLAYWRQADKFGNVRICKYVEQLLEIARTKQGKIDEARRAQVAQMSLPL